MMNLDGKTVTEPENLNDLCAEDKWILSHLNTVIREATENMEKYELGIAVQKVYDFLWDELCDWYIEMAKVRLWKAEEDPKAANDALWTLRTALTEGLKLLHPYMPFITEEIYCTLLPEEESIMISEWPVYREERNFPDAEKAIEGFKEVVRGIRNTRTEMNVPNNRKTSLHIVAKDAETAAMYENSKKSFVNLAFAKEILVQTDKERNQRRCSFRSCFQCGCIYAVRRPDRQRERDRTSDKRNRTSHKRDRKMRRYAE